MIEYVAEIDLPCLMYSSLFYVRANNKKNALEKVYSYCKDNGYEYCKKDIKIYLITELFKTQSKGDVVELH